MTPFTTSTACATATTTTTATTTINQHQYQYHQHHHSHCQAHEIDKLQTKKSTANRRGSAMPNRRSSGITDSGGSFSARSMHATGRSTQGVELSDIENTQPPPASAQPFTPAPAPALGDLHATSSKRVNNAVEILDFTRLKILPNKRLGSGSSAIVYEGRWCGAKCAVKVLFAMEVTPTEIQRTCQEASLLHEMHESEISRNCVVGLVGVAVLPPSLCVVLELCTGGSLSDVLYDQGRTLTWKERLEMAVGCARGVVAFHAALPSYSHNDIKSGNFLCNIPNVERSNASLSPEMAEAREQKSSCSHLCGMLGGAENARRPSHLPTKRSTGGASMNAASDAAVSESGSQKLRRASSSMRFLGRRSSATTSTRLSPPKRRGSARLPDDRNR